MKLAKTYEPQQYETTTYALWETSGAFEPSKKTTTGEYYSIVMPPPNANGNLHTGHALGEAIRDVLIRYHRMSGKKTVYIPGADHAGFETWVVFEKQLEKQGKSRFDYSREELYQMTWDFVAAQRGNMEIQMRELGVSCDWGKQVFTLDKNVVDVAYQTFKKLWDDKLIYRGKRLVNYCTKHHTGFSDIEVVYEDRKTPLYYLKYGPFELATTRPETKFGDTAVAVHPGDERYKKYVGQEIEVEGVNGPFRVKVVADEYVDPKFGTGAVKITPAHDFNDWEVGERHHLPAIQVIDLDGKMNEKAGRFAGLTVLEARAAVVKTMQEKNLIVKIDENYTNRVGVCYKCGTVIEPMLLDQWFVNMAPLAKPAIEAVEQGSITFYPKSKGKLLIAYLKNLRDWNISRQIPWGIPIPAFQNVDDETDWIFDTRVTQEQLEINGKTYRRDPDTFDTWFSSGQWPFITTKHNPGGDLSEFYPTSVMETGHDLLDRWVARMIMLGLYCTGDVPFHDVYLHGMVLDPHGQKMSKSKGNVMNPHDSVAEYGSDALRMGIIANRGAGVSQAFSSATVVAGRNFCNKLWNMARYIEDKIGDDYKIRQPLPSSLADHWVLQKIAKTNERMVKALENYRMAEAYAELYHLVWDDVADWYVEASKVELNKPLLAYTLETLLKLAHPFAPFVTETIWQTLKWEDGLLMSTSWPQPVKNYDPKQAKKFTELQTLVGETRYVANELGQGKQHLLYMADDLIEQSEPLVKHLANLKGIERVSQPRGLRLATVKHEAWLDVDQATLQAHHAKLSTRLNDCQAGIERLQVRLDNKNYVTHAPAAVVQQTRDQLSEQQLLAERLQRELQLIAGD
ncbi:MAG TPA: valine--tRNA ligase [Candidatus Acidoferrum sp.]|nr:valine--tRNA ligase [Candidatus Acidoferrum sp.]